MRRVWLAVPLFQEKVTLVEPKLSPPLGRIQSTDGIGLAAVTVVHAETDEVMPSFTFRQTGSAVPPGVAAGIVKVGVAEVLSVKLPSLFRSQPYVRASPS